MDAPAQDAPAGAPGEVSVSADQIEKLMAEQRAAGRAEVEKNEPPEPEQPPTPAPEEKAAGEKGPAKKDKAAKEKTPEPEKPKGRRGRKPKEEKAGPGEPGGTGARKGRPPKADKAAPDKPPSPPRDKMSQSKGASLADIINLAENLEYFEFYPDIENEDDLGRYYAEGLPIPAELKDYVDYESYGRDISTNENGHFSHGGYVVQTSDIEEIYHGTEDIPKEHKVFALPQLSIREQMAAYKEVIDLFPPASDRARPEPGREGR